MNVDVNLTSQLCFCCNISKRVENNSTASNSEVFVPICDVNIRMAKRLRRKYEPGLRLSTYLFTEKVALFVRLYDDNLVSSNITC